MGSMRKWQWSLLQRRYFSDVHPRNTHAPVGGTQRRLCAHCGKGRTKYVCSGCYDTPLHVQCFSRAHSLTPAGTGDAEEREPPLS